VKSSDQANAREDEGGAHGDGADDSPEQNSVLHGLGQIEIAEDEEKDKKIVGAEGELDDVAGGKFEGGGVSLPDVEEGGEGGGKRDPQAAPDECLPHFEGLGAAVEDAQIERQHRGYENVEENPD